jgi:hypothetical protein
MTKRVQQQQQLGGGGGPRGKMLLELLGELEAALDEEVSQGSARQYSCSLLTMCAMHFSWLLNSFVFHKAIMFLWRLLFG